VDTNRSRLVLEMAGSMWCRKWCGRRANQAVREGQQATSTATKPRTKPSQAPGARPLARAATRKTTNKSPYINTCLGSQHKTAWSQPGTARGVLVFCTTPEPAPLPTTYRGRRQRLAATPTGVETRLGLPLTGGLRPGKACHVVVDSDGPRSGAPRHLPKPQAPPPKKKQSAGPKKKPADVTTWSTTVVATHFAQ